MAQIWKDNSGSMNNVVWDNATQTFRFKWDFITFSGETQDKAEVRWRKMGLSQYASSMISIAAFPEDLIWPAANFVAVGRHSFSTGFNITAIDIPVGTLSPGMWNFQVRFWQTGGTEWSGWTSHKIEVTPWDERQTFAGASTSVVKGPHFQTEGQYGARVAVISAAGIEGYSSNEQLFDVWETNKYLKLSDGTIHAVPENIDDNEGVVGRVTRIS